MSNQLSLRTRKFYPLDKVIHSLDNWTLALCLIYGIAWYFKPFPSYFQQNADGSLMDDVMTYFTDRDKAEGDEEWGRLVKDLQDTG